MATKNDRVATVANDVIETIKECLAKNHVSHAEYRAAWAWLIGLAESGEVPLFLDVFFESAVERSWNEGKPGCQGSLLGPFHLEDVPTLERPYVLPMRDDEPGEDMVFVGSVQDLDGNPLPDATVDMWQSSNDGTYSGFVGDCPRENLRGVMKTDADGVFAVRTIRPVPYRIPDTGPTGEFLDMLGRHAWRPAHFHFIIRADGYEPLITQLYFRGDEWLEKGDVVDGVKDSLIIDVGKSDDSETLKTFGLSEPASSAEYAFRLRPAD